MKPKAAFLLALLVLAGLQIGMTAGCVGGYVEAGGPVYYGGDPWFYDSPWVYGGGGWYGGFRSQVYVHPGGHWGGRHH